MSNLSPNKKIVFVTPPYDQVAPGYGFVKHITNRSPSLGLLHLAAQARVDGYDPSILESDIQGLDVNDVVKRIVDERPSFLGITLFTVGVWSATEIARKVKKELPDIEIIIGGPHVSSMGTETMERFSEFDVAVVGEGEITLSLLLPVLEKNQSPAEILGIIYRDKNSLPIKTAPLAINKSLDSLPFPAWDLLPGFPESYLPAIYDYPAGPVATIAASRGCPFHCRFCDTSTFGAKVRSYSPEKVFEMMRRLREEYGVRHILFVDDLFLASKVRVTKLCELLVDSALNMTWSCTARVDTVKPETLRLMRRAGCWEISLGLESGSNELLQKMDKVASVEASEQAVGWIAEAGIRVKGLFMLGYPGENKVTIEQTKEFVRRIPMNVMNLTKFTPYPGSPIYSEIYGTRIREDHWKKMNGMNFVWSPKGMTVKQLDKDYQRVLTAFYSRPGISWYYLKMTLRHPYHMIRLLRFCLGFFSAKARSIFRGNRGVLIGKYETNLD